MISFKANYIGQTTVKKIINNNTFKDAKVSVVEFNTESEKDKAVLSSIHEHWGPADIYSTDIFYSYIDKIIHPERNNSRRFFALTQQSKNFENINRDDILGLMQVSKTIKDENRIDYIQTNPEYMPQYYFRNFKNIGSALLKYAKNIFPTGDIILYSVPTTQAFYEKFGYIIQNVQGRMVLKR